MSSLFKARRGSVVAVLVGALVLAGLTVTRNSTAHVTAETFNIQYSTANSRGNPMPLVGSNQTGNVTVFTNPIFPSSSIRHVDFWLDQTVFNNTTRYSRERGAPYDFNGSASGNNANFFDMSTLADGVHNITMRVKFSDGHKTVVSADFTVGTGGGGAPTGPYELGVAEFADRLEGAAEIMPPPPGFPLEALIGRAFIYLGDSSSCTLVGCPPISSDITVESVDYYIDDPTTTGAGFVNTDLDAPFDLTDGDVTVPDGFDFDMLPAGLHSITTVVHEVGGNTVTFTREFVVVPVNQLLPQALELSMLEEDPQLIAGAGIIKNRAAAIALGKAYFWDIQTGSNGDVSCANCHYHAGADNRILNTVNPGPNGNFDAVPFAGEILDTADYPFHKFANQLTGQGGLDQSFDDIAGSQGVVKKDFVNINLGNPVDTAGGPASAEGTFLNAMGDPVRQSTGRNTPTNINAIFNIRCFWDGRANFEFNGVNPFGLRDPSAKIYRNNGGGGSPPTPEQLRIKFGCTASQAVGPPLSNVEMSWDRRTFPELGRKLISLQPLALQVAHSTDSVFGPAGLVPSGGAPGLNKSYEAMIKAAFDDSLWDGGMVVLPLGNGGSASYRQIEANFALFWGLSIQLWESTLISHQSKFDVFRRAGQVALDAALASAADGIDNVGVAILTSEEARGMESFIGGGACVFCHGGPVLSAATVPFIRQPPIPPEGPEQIIERMLMEQGAAALEAGILAPPNAIYDVGFYNIGIRPTFEDLGIGGVGDFGNPLSFVAQISSGVFVDDLTVLNNSGGPIAPKVLTIDPCLFAIPFSCQPLAGLRIAVDGAFKVPTLRNIALTGPYMHNGGMSTLDQVVKFYARGADFFDTNIQDLDPEVGGIGNIRGNQDRVDEVVAFMHTFTDPRVATEAGPFDHPTLVFPNGVFVAATGAAGGAVLPTFIDRLEGPTAKADNYPTGINIDVVENVSDNDSDGTGGALSDFQLISMDGGMTTGPLNGTLTWSTTTGAFTYDPDVTFRGVDRFAYDMMSGGTRSNVAIVTIQVGGAAPVAEPDGYVMTQDTVLSILANGVLANDTDADTANNLLTATWLTGPSSGTLTGGIVNADGSFVYTPTPGFIGTDSFTYRVNDPEGPGSTTTVTIMVNSVVSASPCTTLGSFGLCFSASPDRSSPLMLEGAGVGGPVYIFLTPINPGAGANIKKVVFSIDSTSFKVADRWIVEKSEPYDFNSTIVAFDADTLTPGAHFITARVSFTDGSSQVTVLANFTH